MLRSGCENYMYAHRAFIGLLGGLLPFICFALGGVTAWKSMSDTYWSAALVPFVGVLCAAGFFLLVYGIFAYYDLRDLAVNVTAGVSAVCIALFPTSSSMPEDAVILLGVPPHISNILHYIFAILFFAALFINVMFLFPLGKHRWANYVYRVCGCFMLIGVPLVFVSIWLTETFLLVPFSVAWIIKGRKLFYGFGARR